VSLTSASTAIQHLQSSEPVKEAIGEFVAARQLSGHPVAVQCWVSGRGEQVHQGTVGDR